MSHPLNHSCSANEMAPQARYWILTIPHNDFTPFLPNGVSYVKGQLEQGNDTGYLHWQMVAYFPKRIRLSSVKDIFGETAHCEATKSEAAEEYVWKEDTRVEGTQFELGKKSFKRNSETDWDQVWKDAQEGRVLNVPADVRVRCYHTIKRIGKDYSKAQIRPQIRVKIFWGVTGTGKSHRAWEEASQTGDVYVKGPTTKWWDGYHGESNVIIDEFRGQIAIEHLLRWFDKYPCYVEEKGGQLPLQGINWWVCSNVDPRRWYPEMDQMTLDALLRRCEITHFNGDLNDALLRQ